MFKLKTEFAHTTLLTVHVMRATLVLSLCKLGLVTQASSLRSRLDHATPLSLSSLPRMQMDP